MKKLIYLTLSLMFFSCSSDDNSTSDDQTNINDVKNNVQSGTWRITKYIDSGTDELYHFNEFNFTFSSSGTLTATNGTLTHEGMWSITSDSSNDDDDGNNGNDVDFNIYFAPSINNFEELSDDWDIISHSATKIELIDISGGNGDTDYLTFEKN